MPLVFQTFPDLPAFTQTVELRQTLYRLRIHWQDRNQAWYCDLSLEEDGTPLFKGRRISPLYGPTVGLRIDGVPPGHILARGRDPYLRKELGDTLLLFYAPEEELQQFAPDDTDRVEVTIP